MYGTATSTASRIASIGRAPSAAGTGNTLLDSLPEKCRAEIVSRAEVIELKRGETISRPGEEVLFIDFPVTAVVSSFQILKDGKTAETAMTGREGALGATAALRPAVSKDFSEVLVGGQALRVNANVFRHFVEESSGCRQAVFEFFNDHLDRVSRRVICNNYHSVEERLCLWLLLVRDRCDEDSLPFTQEQVSFFLGVHRPSVTLAMQDLREKGIVDYSRGTVHVKETEKLIDLACSCYSSLSVRRSDPNGNARMLNPNPAGKRIGNRLAA